MTVNAFAAGIWSCRIPPDRVIELGAEVEMGATAAEVLNYLSRKFGMTIRPNHLGMTLQRHRRAGQLENRNQRWYLPPLA